jgi:hypothetical protein
MVLYPGEIQRQIRDSGRSKLTFYIHRKEVEAQEQRTHRRGAMATV